MAPSRSNAEDLLKKAKELLAASESNKAKLETLITTLEKEFKACKNSTLTGDFYKAYENLDEAIKRL